MRHESRPADAVPMAVAPLPQGPRGVIEFGGVTHYQVNLGAAGTDLIGDAANEPSFAIDPLVPNRLVAGWRQFDTIENSFRQAGYSWSSDGGRTWAPKRTIEGGIFRSDPVLGAGADGTFYYLSLQVTAKNEFFCDMFVSADHGMSWPVKAFAFGGDKAWFAIDPATSNFYQPWNTAGNLYFPNQFNRSLSGGTSWEEPVTYDPDGSPPARPVFGILDVGPQGEVYVAGARNSATSDDFWVVKSIDAQVAMVPSFVQHTVVDMGGDLKIGVGPNPQGLLGQVEIAVDQSSGNVYVACPIDPPGDDPMDIHFVRSEDGGLTFSPPVRVNDDPMFSALNWQWMAAMDVAPNGRIDMVWNDTRGAFFGTLDSALYYAFSTDGGVTWSPNQQISPPFDPLIGWPQQQKIGDYYQLRSDNVGASLIWAATFNGGQDVYLARIGDHDCDRNGTGDLADIAAGALDCDGDGNLDACEIAAGTLLDANNNGIPDSCETCEGDVTFDGIVGFEDLLAILNFWGPCPSLCAADIDGDGDIGFNDLLVVLKAWGDCA